MISYEAWMMEVDTCIMDYTGGLTSTDLADLSYYSLYLTAMSPEDAAQKAIELS